MRVLFCIILLILLQPLAAQVAASFTFHGQPVLDKGVSVEPYAFFYENPEGDTTQSLTEVTRQQFLPLSASVHATFHNNRQMERTSQVVWLQFRIINAHPTDTLRLWYGGGPHAFLTLYRKDNGSFHRLTDGGICSAPENQPLGPLALPLLVPPQTAHQYFVRVADYYILIEAVAGALHTKESYQSYYLKEVANTKLLFITLMVILGCLLLMSLYSLSQYILNRDKAFLFYGLYAALAFCWILKFANPRLELGLLSFMPWLSHPWAISFTPVLSLVYALFLTKLLSTPREQPKLWQVIRPLMVLLFLLQLLAIVQLFTGPLITSAALFFALDALPALVMGILLIIATIRSHSKLKPFMLAGEISLYLIALSPLHGFFVQNKVSPQLHAIINYPPFFMALGLFIELFCFLLALAYRNKLMEVEKNSLQQQYTTQLKTELDKRTTEIKEQSRMLEEQHATQLKLGFEQKLAEMEMSALRAQMNPHFIFNCLNSIKLYTTDNEAAKASAYLTKFSRLIRLVLENSRSERVTLKNELEALELYLEMEVMRFKEKLRFTLDVAREIDTDIIDIPPMLLQPYVENAIWHGLMHKKEGGHVQIRVVQPQADRLLVTITDDGVGRAKAAALKSKSAIASKSFGMKVTDERIALINQIYQTKTQVRVHDLADAEGRPAGTEVLLEILI
jgi:sensor histidine kinase YesM